MDPERHTQRLVMRRWREADRGPFAELNADPAVMEHFPAALSRAQSDDLVDRADAHLADQGWGLWALEVAAGPYQGRFAGFTGLAVPSVELPFTPCVEVGWRLPVWAWGHGYASEAAREALTVGFEEVGLSEIVSFTARTNLRSQAVMRRIGMHRDAGGDFEHPRIAVGHPTRPHVLYRIGYSAFSPPRPSA